jgi:hypothetical protein
MTKRILLLVLLLSSTLAHVVAGQNGKRLLPNIDQAVTANAPEWKVEHKDATDRGVMVEWRSAERPARLIIMIADSRKQAHDWFRHGALHARRDIGPNGSKTKLKGLGSEAYMATEFMKKDWVTICFRRGRLYAQVFAPTEQAVKLLAQLIAQQVGAT